MRWTKRFCLFLLSEMGYKVECKKVDMEGSPLHILRAKKGEEEYQGVGITPKLALLDILEQIYQRRCRR